MKLHVLGDWLDQIDLQRKVIEGRVGHAGKYDHLIGEIVEFFNYKKSVFVQVIDVYHYNTLDEYIEASGWKTIAPQCNSLSETMNKYLHISATDSDSATYFVFSYDRIKEKGGINALLIKRV